MSRKLLLSSIAIAATATLLGAGTFAKFSDTEISKVHSVQAGTLDLQILNGTAGYSYPGHAEFAVTNAAPGMTSAPADTKYVVFKNVGTLPGKVFVKVVMDSNEENGAAGPEAAVDTTRTGDLGDNLLVSIDGIGSIQNQPLAALDAAPAVQWGSYVLDPGAEGTVSVDWAIPETVGNVIQSDSVSFHLEFTLEQV